MAFNGLLAAAKISAARMPTLAEQGFPNGAHVVTIGPILIAIKSRKPIVLPGDGSEALAPAPELGEAWREKAPA